MSRKSTVNPFVPDAVIVETGAPAGNCVVKLLPRNVLSPLSVAMITTLDLMTLLPALNVPAR